VDNVIWMIGNVTATLYGSVTLQMVQYLGIISVCLGVKSIF